MEGDSVPEPETDEPDAEPAPTLFTEPDRGVAFDDAMEETATNLFEFDSIDQDITTNILSANMDQSDFC